jgi:sugar phosphate isomerase/epimerase
MRDFSNDHEWLSINTATVRKQRGTERPLQEIIEDCARRGIRAISPWRDQVATAGLANVSKLVRTHGIALSGYCRGGMFTAANEQGLKAAHADNLRAVDEACELNAACLVLVVGGLPGALTGKALHNDITLARNQVTDGIAALLEYAKINNMPLAIEPLHPMYAFERACINTMEQALDVCDLLNPSGGGALGVAVDVYHVAWDPKLQAQIKLADTHGRYAERPGYDGRRCD